MKGDLWREEEEVVERRVEEEEGEEEVVERGVEEEEKRGEEEEEKRGEEEERRRRRRQKKRSKNWSRQETLRLIKLRSDLEPRFARSGRKSKLWDEISAGLQGENVRRDAQQCRDKWEKLTAGYKEVRDGVKSRHDNPFFEDLHPLLSARDRDRKENVTAPLPAQGEGAIKDENEDGEQTEEGGGDQEEAAEVELAKRRRRWYVTAGEVEEMVEKMFARQQKLLSEVVDSMERKEETREQMRQEKEERWRAEERAERCAVNKAMVALTGKVVEAEQGGVVAGWKAGGKKRSKNWKKGEVVKLIKYRGEMEGRFGRSSRRAPLWEEVAEMLMGEGIRREGKQCREKWDKLVAEFREVAEGKREQRDSPFYTHLTAILTTNRTTSHPPPPPPPDVAMDQNHTL